MAVVDGEQRANLEITHDRQVDQEAEYTGADEIPGAHGHDEIKRPLMGDGHEIAGGIALRARYFDEVPRIQRQQSERNDFERGEDGAERHVGLTVAVEIPMVPGTDAVSYTHLRAHETPEH